MDRARTPPDISIWMFCQRVQFSRPRFTQLIWGRGGELKEIESRHKLSLSGDDSINLESFTWELPKAFGGSLTLNMSTIKGSCWSSFVYTTDLQELGGPEVEKGTQRHHQEKNSEHQGSIQDQHPELTWIS